MQKLFYVRSSGVESFVNAEVKKINSFIGSKGKIVSVIPCNVAGIDNTVDWMIVADNSHDTLALDEENNYNL